MLIPSVVSFDASVVHGRLGRDGGVPLDVGFWGVGSRDGRDGLKKRCNQLCAIHNDY